MLKNRYEVYISHRKRRGSRRLRQRSGTLIHDVNIIHIVWYKFDVNVMEHVFYPFKDVNPMNNRKFRFDARIYSAKIS